MAGRQKEIDSPDRTVGAKKSIGKISILICIFVAALVINGVLWIVDQNVKIHNAEESLSELKTAVYSAEKADGGSDDVFVRNMELQKATAQNNKHSIVLEDRKNMTLTGIEEVSSFDERKIVLLTELDQLTITGHSLKITSFSPNTGDLRVSGTIDSLVYAEKNRSTRDFRGRIFRERIEESLRTRLNPVNRLF